MVNAFNKKIEKAGYESGIYSNQDYIQSEKFTTWLISKYPLWFAKYALVKGKYANKGKKEDLICGNIVLMGMEADMG